MKSKKIDNFVIEIIPLIDVSLTIFVFIFGNIFKKIRKIGIQKFPLCRKIFLDIGVFPIIDHYYEPLFDDRKLRFPLSSNRFLPGISWNEIEQINILNHFSFNKELEYLSFNKTNENEFYLDNGAFKSGDAEYWYNIIRFKKPKTIIEVGSGNSTLMAIRAIKQNTEDDPTYKCNHICLEPYENPWLENLDITIIRKKIETLDINFFLQLQENDILFIDSSHIIRPQGDVLYIYLQILPALNKGVIVHIHDIFSPKDYLKQWIVDEVKLWNEQYLLEAFLTNNTHWKIIGALNFLHHNHFSNLKVNCPYLEKEHEPGSFYIQKIN